MKEISTKIYDDLYRRASRKVGDLEAEVNQHVTKYLEALNGDDGAILDARNSHGRSLQSNQELWRGRKAYARRNA